MDKKKKLKIALAAVAITLALIPLAVVLIYVALERAGSGETEVRATPTPAVVTLPPTPYIQRPVVVVTPRPEETPEPPEEIATPSGLPGETPDTPASLWNNIADANPELAAALDEVSSRNNCASVSIAEYDRNRGFTTYQYGYADIENHIPVDENTKIRASSLSELVTTICALILADNGTINLDEDISNYLGYSVRNPNHPDLPITPRMLMQHTSSIFDSEDYTVSLQLGVSTGTSTRDLLDSGTSFLVRMPGNSHIYSNFGIAVLGAVCESASGMLIDTLARNYIFDPLGIDAAYMPDNLSNIDNIAVIYGSSHNVSRSVAAQISTGSSGIPGRDHHLAQGSLTISPIDYARILVMLCDGGVIDGVRILSEAMVNELHKANVSGGSYMQGLTVRFHESALVGDSIYWHTGSGYGVLCEFIYCRETGRVVVAFTTGSLETRMVNGMIEVCTELILTAWDSW